MGTAAIGNGGAGAESKVDKTTTVNGKELSGNVTLDLKDIVGAAEATRINSLASGGWFDSFAAWCDGSDDYAGLDDKRCFDLAALPAPTGYTRSGTLPGVVHSGSSVIAPLSHLVVMSPAAPWAACFDAIIPVPASGKASVVGLAEPVAGIQWVFFGAVYAVNATRLVLYSNNKGTVSTYWPGPVIDGARHTYRIGFDASRVKLYMDGVLQITSDALGTTQPVDPLALVGFSTHGALLHVSRAASAV